MRLGPYTLPSPWILAPMAGVSELPFRRIARELGAAAAPTELVSAKGLLYGQERTKHYLRHDARETPFWVQLFGGDPDSMAEGAAVACDLGADVIDVNMGCPVRKVTRSGAGSALLTDPERAASIVQAIERKTGKPVTAKIRSGWDAHSINFENMSKALADVGCVAIAMHARTRTQGYSGTADWTQIARLKDVSPIPVIGNGDVFSPEHGRRMVAETGCDAVMIGRGALGNPWIFERLTTPSATPPAPSARWRLIEHHLREHLAHVGEALRGIRRFRPHLLWYAHGLPHAAKFRREVVQIDALDALLEHCAAFYTQAQSAEEARRGRAGEVRGALG